jgi:predicted aspartyl protease
MVKRIVAAAGLIATLGLGWVGAASAQSGKDCKLSKIAELPFKFEYNKALVQVTINGKVAWFAVDTGAGDSSMFGGAARTLGLSETTVDGMRVYGVGGGQDAKSVVISEFGLGKAKVKDVRFYSIGHRGSPEFAGLLGRDFLDGVGDMEFDIVAHALRFWKPQDCGNRSLAYWTKTPLAADIAHDEMGAPYTVKMMINGKRVDAELDSGSDTTVVTPEVARSVGLPPQNYATEVRQTGGIGEAAVATRIATFDSVIVGDEEIKHARLQVADLFAADTEMRTGSLLAKPVEGLKMPGMLLGADFLRSHRALLVAEQHLLYFTYSGGPVFQIVGEPVKPKNEPAAAGGAAPTPK